MTAVWPELLSSALVGVDRRPLKTEPLDGPLGGVAPGGDLDAEGVLSAAGVLTVARRAGAAAVAMELPTQAPQESKPLAPQTGDRLGRLLSDVDGDHRTRRDLIREWLELASARGMLAAPRHLVSLADLARSESALRPLVKAVGGERLAWLAAIGPGRWAWAAEVETVESPTDDDWATGKIDVRARYLELARQADPGRGRELLLAVWAQEKAVDLAALIRACRTGLDGEDESWLERGLDDKRVQVREASAELLSVLPRSGYRLRMAQRALACVQTDGKRKLAVTPPAEFDADLRRDGLTQKPPYGMGERAWLLLQIVSATPLEIWSTVDPDPAELLRRKVNDNWDDVLLQGWTRAAMLQRDATWALALCRRSQGQSTSLTELLAVLSQEQAAEIALDAVKRNDGRMNELLGALPRPWPDTVAQAVLHHISDPKNMGNSYRWYLPIVAEFGLSPNALPQVRALLAQATEGRHEGALEQLASTLQIRYDIHQEFA